MGRVHFQRPDPRSTWGGGSLRDVTVGSEEEDDMLSLHLNCLRIARGLRTWAFQLRGRWGEILVPGSVTGHGAAVQ